MVKCPECGHEFSIKLECKRCGHIWHPKDPNHIPEVCPNPKCKSPYWNRERVRKKTEKGHSSRKRGEGDE